MNVAVPWLKHSWMFGQLASSHTVTRRFSRSLALSCCTELPDGMRTRIHDGLRRTGASANCTGERAILSPATCFTPGCSEADAASPLTTASGMVLEADSVMACVDLWSGGSGSGASSGWVQNVGGGAVWTCRPNWRATCPMSTGLTASSPEGPPKSSIEVTCSPW